MHTEQGYDFRRFGIHDSKDFLSTARPIQLKTLVKAVGKGCYQTWGKFYNQDNPKKYQAFSGRYLGAKVYGLAACPNNGIVVEGLYVPDNIEDIHIFYKIGDFGIDAVAMRFEALASVAIMCFADCTYEEKASKLGYLYGFNLEEIKMAEFRINVLGEYETMLEAIVGNLLCKEIRVFRDYWGAMYFAIVKEPPNYGGAKT